MSNPPLPGQLDVRKLAIKGIEIAASAAVSNLPRVVDLLADDKGSIEVSFHFYIDEQRFKRIDGRLSSTVKVFCQRCLEPMSLSVESEFKLAIVWSEEGAERLPKFLEPLIVGEELVDLADVVSEEFILSMPFVNYHEPDQCRQSAVYSSDDAGEVESEQPRKNPFQALDQLKFDK